MKNSVENILWLERTNIHIRKLSAERVRFTIALANSWFLVSWDILYEDCGFDLFDFESFLLPNCRKFAVECKIIRCKNVQGKDVYWKVIIWKNENFKIWEKQPIWCKQRIKLKTSWKCFSVTKISCFQIIRNLSNLGKISEGDLERI